MNCHRHTSPRALAVGPADEAANAYVHPNGSASVMQTVLAEPAARSASTNPDFAIAAPRARRAEARAPHRLRGAALPPVLLVLPFIALAIATTSRGPVLFRQVRTGRGGRPITIYKFRTMHRAARSGPPPTASCTLQGFDIDAFSAASADVDGASSPRLTRCKTVWRETPSARIASRMARKPSGTVSAKRAAARRSRRIRQGAPGVTCSPANEAGLQPAMDRGGGHAELLGRPP